MSTGTTKYGLSLDAMDNIPTFMAKVDNILPDRFSLCNTNFVTGLKIMEEIFAGTSDWKALFASVNFFHKYKYCTCFYFLLNGWLVGYNFIYHVLCNLEKVENKCLEIFLKAFPCLLSKTLLLLSKRFATDTSIRNSLLIPQNGTHQICF